MARRLLPYGERAMLVECADLAEMRALHSWLKAWFDRTDEAGRDGRPSPIAEVIPGARTLLLRLRTPLDPGFVRTMIETELPATGPGASTMINIPVRYDGDDLPEVATLLGCTTDEVIDLHTRQTWTVAFCGFAPGFAYLAPEDAGTEDVLRVPRRAAPRTKVPAGSVGLADRWSGIYPRTAPGGWQLIGRTPRQVWDLQQQPPALLQPGMRVRFEVAR